MLSGVPASVVPGVAESLGPGVSSCLGLRRVSSTSGVRLGCPRRAFGDSRRAFDGVSTASCNGIVGSGVCSSSDITTFLRLRLSCRGDVFVVELHHCLVEEVMWVQESDHHLKLRTIFLGCRG